MTQDIKCDALIIGCGITGSLMAEQLTFQGLDVVVIDREHAGSGSTAASTSMLLWEIDRPLRELSNIYGFDRAKRAYSASFQAVGGLRHLASKLGLPCQMREKNSLYLASGTNNANLREEHRLRMRAGFPGLFLDQDRLLKEFEIRRSGAIVSPGSADADPVQLARALLRVAIDRGARMFAGETIAYDSANNSVGVQLTNGCTIEARHVILATGYVMPKIVKATVQSPSSSWAIATKPQPHNIWKGSALIWEDSTDYIYARSTSDGRIIIGGEDSDSVIDGDARDALIPQKSRALADKLTALWPRAELDIDYRWSGTFDTTKDGLPLIGPVPGAKGVHAAYGYGGNGITFSYLAAKLIGSLINGTRSNLLDDFSLERSGS